MTLKRRFPEYFERSDAEFSRLFHDALFVFDASVLLNIYRLSAKSRDDLKRQLTPIARRMWLAAQTAHEYGRNRRKAIRQRASAGADTIKEVESTLKRVKTFWERREPAHAKRVYGEIEKILSTAIADIKKTIDETEDDELTLSNDPVLAMLEDLFGDRIGEDYERAKLEEIYSSGALRYERKIPPGFKDLSKGDPSQYGDLVFWHQVIDLAAKEQKPIVLIIDDRKEDWWLRDSEKTLGPQPALIAEMRALANQEVHLSDTVGLLEQLSKATKKKPVPELTREVRTIKAEDEAARDLTAVVELAKRSLGSSSTTGSVGMLAETAKVIRRYERAFGRPLNSPLFSALSEAVDARRKQTDAVREALARVGLASTYRELGIALPQANELLEPDWLNKLGQASSPEEPEGK